MLKRKFHHRHLLTNILQLNHSDLLKFYKLNLELS